MKKITVGFAIAAVVLVVGSFYGGIRYSQTKGTTPGAFMRGNFPGSGMMQGRSGGAGGLGGMRSGMNFTAGEIIAKDATSITVKLPDGGSKIIFYSDSTEVGKFVTGTASDLEIGKTINVNGKANADGSVTAQSIQMRPLISPPAPLQ